MPDRDVDALVQSGRYASKGAARRVAGNYSTPKPTKNWQRKLLAGLAGRPPQLPNKEG